MKPIQIDGSSMGRGVLALSVLQAIKELTPGAEWFESWKCWDRSTRVALDHFNCKEKSLAEKGLFQTFFSALELENGSEKALVDVHLTYLKSRKSKIDVNALGRLVNLVQGGELKLVHNKHDNEILANELLCLFKRLHVEEDEEAEGVAGQEGADGEPSEIGDCAESYFSALNEQSSSQFSSALVSESPSPCGDEVSAEASEHQSSGNLATAFRDLNLRHEWSGNKFSSTTSTNSEKAKSVSLFSRARMNSRVSSRKSIGRNANPFKSNGKYSFFKQRESLIRRFWQLLASSFRPSIVTGQKLNLQLRSPPVPLTTDFKHFVIGEAPKIVQLNGDESEAVGQFWDDLAYYQAREWEAATESDEHGQEINPRAPMSELDRLRLLIEFAHFVFSVKVEAKTLETSKARGTVFDQFLTFLFHDFDTEPLTDQYVHTKKLIDQKVDLTSKYSDPLAKWPQRLKDAKWMP